MAFTRSNRIRSTGTLMIFPMSKSQTGWCVNEHKTQSGLLRVAAYHILVMGYPFGLYCQGCAKEIWKTWSDIIKEEDEVIAA